MIHLKTYKLGIKYLFYFVIITFVSCNKSNEYFLTTDESVKDVFTRFPLLNDMEYKTIRKISFHDNFEIELKQSYNEQEEENFQQIAIFKNSNNHYYAIPLLSNQYEDFWQFHISNLETTFKSNSTFEKEFNEMLNKLNLLVPRNHKNAEQLAIVTNEFMISVLHAKNDFAGDSLLKNTIFTNSNYIKNRIENSDSCLSRCRKNLKVVNLNSPFTYFDTGNGRIYEFRDDAQTAKELPKIRIKNYRQDCINFPISY